MMDVSGNFHDADQLVCKPRLHDQTLDGTRRGSLTEAGVTHGSPKSEDISEMTHHENLVQDIVHLYITPPDILHE